MTTRSLLAAAALVVVAGFGPAQKAFAQSVPESGLVAEGEGRWDDAVQVYRETLKERPGRPDLWLRIADIEAHLGHQDESIAALECAVESAASDASIYERLSQAYSQADKPSLALKAMQRALALQPNNAAYHQAVAVLTAWLGDYRQAQEHYKRAEQLGATDPDVILNLARVYSWAGDTDQAVETYRRYLSKHAEAAAVWLELARTESWRGNYGGALDALNAYAMRFGTTEAYSRELAGVLASNGHPSRAIELLDPLLSQSPSNYALNLIRTIAFAELERPRETFDSLDALRQLQPTSRETQSAEQTVRVQLGSSVTPGVSYYGDSDRLTVQRFSPWGTAIFSNGTHVSAGYDYEILAAPVNSGLASANGRNMAYDLGWGAVGQVIKRLTIEGRLGTASTDTRRLTPYDVNARIRASDAITISGEYSSGFFVISPRTLDLGLTERRSRLSLEWDPAARYHVSLDGNYQDISDGNARQELTATVRRAMARTERLNLDLGVSAYTLSADQDLHNGYYDPKRYESYALVFFPYFKINENAGLGLSLAGGIQREYPTSFRFGGNAGAEATIGIYRPWALKFGATLTNNRRAESGAFSGYGGSVVLVRRF